MYGRKERQMDRIMDRQTIGRIDQEMDKHAIYLHRHAINNDFSINFAIFTKALRTNRRTNRQTDRRTDIPSYRDAISASKNWKKGWDSEKNNFCGLQPK